MPGCVVTLFQRSGSEIGSYRQVPVLLSSPSDRKEAWHIDGRPMHFTYFLAAQVANKKR